MYIIRVVKENEVRRYAYFYVNEELALIRMRRFAERPNVLLVEMLRIGNGGAYEVRKESVRR